MAASSCPSSCRFLQQAVYGQVNEGDFPRSLLAGEAGSGEGGRRYLWTDAFGVMNYISEAMAAGGRGDELEKESSLLSAKLLLDKTLLCLGSPRSEKFPMIQNEDGSFKGLRIGKTEAREISDAGMRYDGMYWHYIDKFLFALQRYAEVSKDVAYVHKAASIIRDIHPYFFVPDRGMYWKLNVDLSPIPGVEPTPSHDAVSAYVVYHLVHQLGGDVSSEINQLKPVVDEYFYRRTSSGGQRHTVLEVSDCLGLGCHLWTMQWLGAQGDDEVSKAIFSYRKQVSQLARTVLDNDIASSGGLQGLLSGHKVPFRVYGGLLGCQLTNDNELKEHSSRLSQQLADMSSGAISSGGNVCANDGLFSINTVMLVSANLPAAWRRLPHETDAM